MVYRWLCILFAATAGLTLASVVEGTAHAQATPRSPALRFSERGSVAIPPGFAAPASLAPLVEALQPCVVNIYTTQKVKVPGMHGGIPWIFRDLFPPNGSNPGFPIPGLPPGQPGPEPEATPEMERQSLGSGVLLSADGFIATNNHVVEGAHEIRVALHDGTELDARVLGTDPKTDLALLQVEASRPLPFAGLGSSEALRTGDWVLAIGNPLGLEETVTVGIVSGKGRVIGAGPYDDFIQTDASINPGNSGGPLFNFAGQVVGINTAIGRGAQGIGFAIPIDVAKNVLSQLAGQGRVVRGWLGVQIQPVDRELALALGLPATRGVMVADVLADSPAARSGWKSGDVVLECNGAPIDQPTALTRLVGFLAPGSQASCTVWREGKRVVLEATVAERQEAAEASAPPKPDHEDGTPVARGAASAALGATIGAREGGGVFVERVDPSGAARKAGIVAGDQILAVDQQPVATPSALDRAIESAKGRERVALHIKRGDTKRFLAIELPKGPVWK